MPVSDLSMKICCPNLLFTLSCFLNGIIPDVRPIRNFSYQMTDVI